MAHNWPTNRKYWSSVRVCAAAASTIPSIGVLRVRGRLSASSASANSLPGSAVAMESPHPAGRVNAVNELSLLQGLDYATAPSSLSITYCTVALFSCQGLFPPPEVPQSHASLMIGP